MADTDKTPPAPALIKARVLTASFVNGAMMLPDAVVELDPVEAAELAAAGAIDPHPEAVAYALSLLA